MLNLVAITVAASFVLSMILTFIVRAVARRVGFVDSPGGHKGHEKPVALGGGVAIFLTLLLPTLAGALAARWALAAGREGMMPAFLRAHLSGISDRLGLLVAIFAGALVLHVVGLIDDAKPLGPRVKFLIQTLVALGLSWGCGIRAAEALGPALSIGITTLWIVLIINAFNFLDNMDGLSAGVAAIAASIFASAAANTGQIFVPLLAWVLVGGLLGFLVFNFAPASIFMGDAGSTVVGYFLAVLTVMTTYFDPEQGLKKVGVLIPLVVMAVPLYDVASVVWIRLRAGDSPFRGDRRHFSHRLVKRGMNVRAAVLTIYLATAATSISAVFLPEASNATAALIFAQTLCIVLIIAVLEHAGANDNP